MLSSFVGWIMFSSSSSSSSSSQYEAEEDDDDHSPNDCVPTEPRDHIDNNIINDEEKNDVVSADDDRDIPVGIAVPTDAFASVVTVALPATGAPMGDRDRDRDRPSIATTTTVIGNRKRRRNDDDDDDDEDGRRLFHRLWTKEDEMELLRGFLDYTTRRGSTQCNDTALFYDQIRSKLHLAFNKNQLLEKLRRLKKKYRNFLHKMGSDKEFSFRNAHDQATFEISRKIWGVDHDHYIDHHPDQPISHNYLDSLNLVNVKVESDEVVGDWRPPKPTKSPLGLRSNEKHFSNNGSTSNQKNDNESDSMEETVRSCLSPLFKELLSNALSSMPAPLNLVGGEAADEKWREQRILELEVYSKRLELIQDQIKGALEELRSMGG